MTTYDLAVVGGTWSTARACPGAGPTSWSRTGRWPPSASPRKAPRTRTVDATGLVVAPGDRRPPHPLRPAAHLRALRHVVLLPRGHHRPGRQLRVLGRPDQEGRPAVHHPDVRPGRGHVGRRPGRPPVGLRDLPRVPGRPAGPHRGEPGLLRRPLGRPPLGHGRRRVRARGHRRRDRRDGRDRVRGDGGRRGRILVVPRPDPLGQRQPSGARPVSRRWRS